MIYIYNWIYSDRCSRSKLLDAPSSSDNLATACRSGSDEADASESLWSFTRAQGKRPRPGEDVTRCHQETW